MKTDFLAKPLAILLMSLGLAVGCASTPEETADTTPADQAEAQPVQAEEAASDTSQSAGSADSYQVVSGDNLWDISAKGDVYANPYQWPLIYKANRSQIKDADLIYPGQVFDIDRNASSSDVDAAIEHAKTRGAWSLGIVEDSDTAYLNQ